MSIKSAKSPQPGDVTPQRLVWQITERAPFGEWIDQSAGSESLVPALGALPEVSTSGGWLLSSFDLLHGMDVDESHDTEPGELFGALPPATDGTIKPI